MTDQQPVHPSGFRQPDPEDPNLRAVCSRCGEETNLGRPGVRAKGEIVCERCGGEPEVLGYLVRHHKTNGTATDCKFHASDPYPSELGPPPLTEVRAVSDHRDAMERILNLQEQVERLNRVSEPVWTEDRGKEGV